ncbi:MAG: uroporphyrinogen-III synthase [Burkholderiaceae bacterium]
MIRPVVITRPRAQAEALAARLAELGVAVHCFPLLEIQPIQDDAVLRDTLGRLRDYAMVAFVSPNAIDAAFAYIDQWPVEVIAAVVGEGSRQALARYGVNAGNAQIVSPIDPNRTDSETLLEVLDLAALKGRRALIVRAETGRELLADRLRSADVEVEQIAAYQRGMPVFDAQRRAQLADLLAQPMSWVITSSEALRYLLEMARQLADETGVEQMLGCQLIVPHPRIAETAYALGFTQVMQTASGDEALVAAIQSAA